MTYVFISNIETRSSAYTFRLEELKPNLEHMFILSSFDFAERLKPVPLKDVEKQALNRRTKNGV